MKNTLFKIKKWVYNLIRDDDINTLRGKIFDAIIITLIILSVASVILETFLTSPLFQLIYIIIEIVSISKRRWRFY